MTEARPPYGAIPPVHPATEQSAVALLAAFAAEHPEAFENYCAGHGEDIDWADAYRSDSPGLRAQPADPVPLPPPSGHGTRQCLRLALSLNRGGDDTLLEFVWDGGRVSLLESSPSAIQTLFRCQQPQVGSTAQVTEITINTFNLDHIGIKYAAVNDDTKPAPAPLPLTSGHGTRQCLRLALSLDSGCEKWMWEFFLDGERLVLAEMPSFHDRLPSPREFRTIFRCQLASILPTDQVTAIVLETLNLDHINIEYLEMNDDSKPHTGNGFKILKKTATPKPDNPRGFQP